MLLWANARNMIEEKLFERTLVKVSAGMKQADFSRYTDIISGSFNQKEFEKDVISDVFWELLSNLGAFAGNGRAGKPEEVVLSLIRLGVDRGRITYRKNRFDVDSGNCRYRIYRESSGCGASSCVIGVGRRYEVTGLTPDELASFILEFDSLIPRIVLGVEGLVRDWKKEVFADIIRKRTARTLVRDFLETVDLSDCDWKVLEDGTVNVSARIVEVREARMTVPLEELKESLDTLKERLETMPRKVEKEKKTSFLKDLKESVFLPV